MGHAHESRGADDGGPEIVAIPLDRIASVECHPDPDWSRHRERLGRKASRVDWIVADITEYTPGRTFDLWHDRATFHFLTDSDDQKKYFRRLNEALDPGGQVIIAAFALDGPRQCSGLDIVRYDGASLGEALGTDFRLEEQVLETHITPLGREQRFGFYRFRRTR